MQESRNSPFPLSWLGRPGWPSYKSWLSWGCRCDREYGDLGLTAKIWGKHRQLLLGLRCLMVLILLSVLDFTIAFTRQQKGSRGFDRYAWCYRRNAGRSPNAEASNEIPGKGQPSKSLCLSLCLWWINDSGIKKWLDPCYLLVGARDQWYRHVDLRSSPVTALADPGQVFSYDHLWLLRHAGCRWLMMMVAILIILPRARSRKTDYQVLALEPSVTSQWGQKKQRPESRYSKFQMFPSIWLNSPMRWLCDFSAQKVKTIAFIGSTGSGEITLVQFNSTTFLRCDRRKTLVDGTSMSRAWEWTIKSATFKKQCSLVAH